MGRQFKYHIGGLSVTQERVGEVVGELSVPEQHPHGLPVLLQVQNHLHTNFRLDAQQFYGLKMDMQQT